MFRELRDRADAALADVAHATEHVGSTAIPGLAAKPVVDLDVVVPDDATVGPAIRALAAAGWRHQEIWASRAGRRSCRLPMPSITTCTSWWRVASRIAITSTCVISCARIPVRRPGTAT